MSGHTRRIEFIPQTVDTDPVFEPKFHIPNPALHVVPKLNTKNGYVLTDNRMVTRKHDILIRIDYPLNEPVNVPLNRKGGWRVGHLVVAIQDLYRRIYKEPKRYGIWGHGISDLVIERIYIDKATQRQVTLGIGS